METACTLTEVQLEVIEFCVRASQTVGIPRSMGEIFGLICSSPHPLNFDDVVRVLGISSGSASHGLRKMCRMGIIRTCYVPRDRRDHYTCETSFRQLVVALIQEHMVVDVCWADERIAQLRQRAMDDTSIHRSLAGTIDMLFDWNTQARKAMQLVLENLK